MIQIKFSHCHNTKFDGRAENLTKMVYLNKKASIKKIKFSHCHNTKFDGRAENLTKMVYLNKKASIKKTRDADNLCSMATYCILSYSTQP